MASDILLRPSHVRTVAFGDIGASYVAIGSKFSLPVRMIFLQNLTDSLLMFSLNSVNDHWPLAAGAFLLLDVTANKISDQGFFIGAGEFMYVKQVVAPSSGSVYLTAFYGTNRSNL